MFAETTIFGIRRLPEKASWGSVLQTRRYRPMFKEIENGDGGGTQRPASYLTPSRGAAQSAAMGYA
jgi:hypothetical protein